MTAIGDPGLHFHDLRHTSNTFAAAGGASLRDLMDRVGHSVRAAVIYQHATTEASRVVADSISGMIERALVLVLGLRRGEVLGLAWDQVDLADAELYVEEQLQRVRGKLVRREAKTETSEAPLPLPKLCVTALKVRKRRQDADRDRAGDGWIDTGLVFATRHGTPIESRNFNRSFDRCIAVARVPRITVHGTRKTCASLLAALDVLAHLMVAAVCCCRKIQKGRSRVWTGP